MRVSENGGSRPVPDPTVLTTQSQAAAIAALREIIETRLNGMDKAIELLQVTNDKFPLIVTSKVSNLHELIDEKFNSIDKQFSERDTRTDKVAELNQKAIDAALQAAKEIVNEQNKSSSQAIAKSEASVTKQIDATTVLIESKSKATDGAFGDIKERLTRIESGAVGMITGRNDVETKSKDNWAWVFGAVGMIGAIVIVIIELLKH